MKLRIILLLAFVFALRGGVAAQEVDTLELFDPAEVFVVEEDVEQQALEAAWQMVAGEWEYSKPYVHAQGSTIMGKLGKTIAKSKIKKGLNKAYKKLKLKNRWQSLVLTNDGQFQMRVLGLPLNGSYTYNPEEESLTLRWKGIPMKSHTHRDGNKLYIAFDTDRLLVILHVISGIGNSEILKSLALLSENYRDVMVGFEMKLVKQ